MTLSPRHQARRTRATELRELQEVEELRWLARPRELETEPTGL
ncbi:hypothetical protein [Nocardioides sp. zg-1230]|nr:hypothetical protein [Nocardioides sp. zg-1230]